MDTGGDRAMRKRVNRKRGAILVETIVAFVILLVVLIGVTALIMTSINMNRKAADTSESMETAITSIENGQLESAGTGTMTVRINGSSAAVDIPVNVGTAGDFVYFKVQ
jgi:Tfp pilus assembly protein PilW